MNVLIVGGGAREHALAWCLSRSPLVASIASIPGNPGLAALGPCHAGSTGDFDRVLAVARLARADLVVIGPEAPLAAGLSDHLRGAGLVVFGPSKDAARIESSKVFARELMARLGVPSARFELFDDHDRAMARLRSMTYPCVVKADGLASGKGAIVCRDRSSAEEAVQRMLVQREFGDAGGRLLIEEFLVGEEVSVLALTDGRGIVTLPPAQDHKTVYEGDEGPNTGGMGAYAPWVGSDAEFQRVVTERILRPVVDALAAEGCPMQGCLYAGLMVTADGPRVVEFNCRFGDPETEVVLPLLKDDLAPLLLACARGRLVEPSSARTEGAAVGVVLASGGYPGHFETGLPISLGAAQGEEDGVVLFHAGTMRGEDGVLRTAGGRVLCVTGIGASVEEARVRAYRAADRVSFAGKHLRRDIGARASAARR